VTGRQRGHGCSGRCGGGWRALLVACNGVQAEELCHVEACLETEGKDVCSRVNQCTCKDAAVQVLAQQLQGGLDDSVSVSEGHLDSDQVHSQIQPHADCAPQDLEIGILYGAQ